MNVVTVNEFMLLLQGCGSAHGHAHHMAAHRNAFNAYACVQMLSMCVCVYASVSIRRSDWSNRGMWYAAGSVHGTQDVKRLLNTVQKQRMEHRKLQRLMLDPSGRAQSNYQQTVLQRLPENDKATDGEVRG